MNQRTLKKITCNLTGKTIQIYEDYYNKKIKQYGSEENLLKYYVQNKIINLIKTGHSFEHIAELFNFNYDSNQISFYKELTDFHKGSHFIYEPSKFIETDEEVSIFIKNWLNYNNRYVHSSSI